MKVLILLFMLLHSVLFGMELKGTLSGTYGKIAVIDSSNYAIVSLIGGSNHGVDIIDFSDPTNLQVIGSYKTTAGVSDIAIYGNFAYLAVSDGKNGGLVVLDIKNPSTPTLRVQKKVRKDPYFGNGWRVSISHDGTKLAFATSHGSHLYDVTNPSSPVKLSDLVDIATYSAYANALVFSSDDKYLFTFADTNEKSHIFDISNPSNIIKVASNVFLNGNINIWEAILNPSDDRLHLKTHHAGIISFDVKIQGGNVTLTNKDNLSTVGNGHGIVITSGGNIVYTAWWEYGGPRVSIHNISSNTSEIFIGTGYQYGNVLDIGLSSDESVLLILSGGEVIALDTGKDISTDFAIDNSEEILVNPGYSVDNEQYDNSLSTTKKPENTNEIALNTNLKNKRTYISVNKPSLDTIVTFNTPSGVKVAKKDLYYNTWSATTIPNTSGVVGQTTKSKYGRLYNINKKSITYSDDDGKTWSKPTIVNKRLNIGGTTMAVDSSKIYIAYHEHGNSYGLHLSYSEDEGKTWKTYENIFNSEAGYGKSIALDSITGDIYIAHGVDHAQRRMVVTKISGMDVTNITHTVIDKGGQFVNSGISAKSGKVYLTYFNAKNNTIKYAYSTNRGKTFSKPEKVYSAKMNTYNNYIGMNLQASHKDNSLELTLAFIEDGVLKTASYNNAKWNIEVIGKVLKTSPKSIMIVDAMYEYSGKYYLYYIDKNGNFREYIKE